MAKRSYDQKLKNINDWIEITNYHWHRLQGQLFDDKEFWEQTLEAMTDQDWWDWCDIEPSIKIQYSEYYDRFPKLRDDTVDLRNKLMLGKSVTRRWGTGKNFTAFRTLMALKDLFNEINGYPTVQYSKQSQHIDNQELTQFERLFEEQ